MPPTKKLYHKKETSPFITSPPIYESRVVAHPVTKVYKKQRYNRKQTFKNFSALLPSPPLTLFKRQIHYDVINWLVFKRQEIYSNIVLRYTMGVRSHIAITVHGSFFVSFTFPMLQA
jgi:hypothetical protein